jgi:hypothetical protein
VLINNTAISLSWNNKFGTLFKIIFYQFTEDKKKHGDLMQVNTTAHTVYNSMNAEVS